MTLNRRGFVAGLAALIAAPAIVRASSMDYVPRGVDITYAPWVKTGPGRYELVGQIVRLNGRGLHIPPPARSVDVRGCVFKNVGLGPLFAKGEMVGINVVGSTFQHVSELFLEPTFRKMTPPTQLRPHNFRAF